MRRWLTMAGMVGMLATALASPGVQAASKTLYVGTCKGSSPYTTIQSAVDTVNDDGFTIYVCPGTYHETVKVEHKDDLTIRNYVVKNQPAPLIDAGGGFGFTVSDSKEVEIRGLRITNADVGLDADESPKTEVRNTTINAHLAGIVFDTGSDKSVAQSNTISGSGDFGIGFGSTTNITVKQNTITSFQIGIFATGTTKPTIESNTATNATGVGILLDRTTDASVRKNTTNFAQYGIALEGSPTNTISENTAKSNSEAGVFVESDATNNSLKKNLLQGNGTDAVDQSSGSKTAGTANTWSNNTCDTSTPSDLCGSPATARRAAPTAPHRPSWPFHR